MRRKGKIYTGTERPASISHMIERMGGGGPIGGGGKLKNPFKSSKQKRKQQGMKTDSQYQSQQNQLEGIKARVDGGSTVGRTGIVKKSSYLKNQKVAKKKKSRDTMEEDARKQDALRKKWEKEKTLNQKEMERLYGKEKVGGWVYPKGYDSKANIRKRIEPTKTLSMWKGIKKRKKANQDKDNWKSPRPDRPSSRKQK